MRLFSPFYQMIESPVCNIFFHIVIISLNYVDVFFFNSLGEIITMYFIKAADQNL